MDDQGRGSVLGLTQDLGGGQHWGAKSRWQEVMGRWAANGGRVGSRRDPGWLPGLAWAIGDLCCFHVLTGPQPRAGGGGQVHR